MSGCWEFASKNQSPPPKEKRPALDELMIDARKRLFDVVKETGLAYLLWFGVLIGSPVVSSISLTLFMNSVRWAKDEKMSAKPSSFGKAYALLIAHR